MSATPDFEMLFDIGTIQHLGIHMYSTLPPVIGELVSNAWDADASIVDVTIPEGPLDHTSEIVIQDNGDGMNDDQIRRAYLVVGRDRRKEEGDKLTRKNRKVMGRKGIGKFSAFGVAVEIELETVRDGSTSRFIMNYDHLQQRAADRKIVMPSLNPTGTVTRGTKVTLRRIQKYRTRRIQISHVRRRLARRFAIIGTANDFIVNVNDDPISPDEQDLTRLLDHDFDGNPYMWKFHDVEVEEGTGWTVTGWIGALDRTRELEDAIQRGIVIYARGKLVQEPFVFEATVGQQFALSYLVGELHAEFVDDIEDGIGTTRNSLVWDTEPNSAFLRWGQAMVNRIAREWADKRSRDNEKELERNPLYQRFVEETKRIDRSRVRRVADKLIRSSIASPVTSQESQEAIIQLCIDFMHYDVFEELSDEIQRSGVEDVSKIITLFREWEVVEAKEMMRVTSGRITTITKLQSLIDSNALEVPILHNFLKEFPWVLDPRWTLVDDEVQYSQLLRRQFPESDDTPNENKRIDFLCVREGSSLVVVEIKRPQSKVSSKELDQIEEYVLFMRDHVAKTTDPDFQLKDVQGYLLCGDLVDTYKVRGRRDNLQRSGIYVRRYADLLRLVKDSHKEFLNRYERLQETKSRLLNDQRATDGN